VRKSNGHGAGKGARRRNERLLFHRDSSWRARIRFGIGASVAGCPPDRLRNPPIIAVDQCGFGQKMDIFAEINRRHR
jgi:hypothetical protein